MMQLVRESYLRQCMKVSFQYGLRRQLVPAAMHDVNARLSKLARTHIPIHVGGNFTRPYDQAVRHACRTHGPAEDGGTALRETEYMQPCGGRMRKYFADQCVQVIDVVRDVCLAILTRHPRRTHAPL